MVPGLDTMFGRSLPAASPSLRMLARYVGFLEESGELAIPELQPTIVKHVHDLVVLALARRAMRPSWPGWAATARRASARSRPISSKRSAATRFRSTGFRHGIGCRCAISSARFEAEE